MLSTIPSQRVLLLLTFPELAEYGRPATRLHPRPGAPGMHDSSVAGPLLWPADEPWPTCTEAHRTTVSREEPLSEAEARRRHQENVERCERSLWSWEREGSRAPSGAVPRARRNLAEAQAKPLETTLRRYHAVPFDEPVVMAPILQVLARDTSAVDFPDGTDLLQILWCPGDHQEPGRVGPQPVAYWRAAGEVGVPIEAAPALNAVHYERWIPKPCTVHPEEVIEYPPVCILRGAPAEHLLGVLPADVEAGIRRRDAGGLIEEISYDVLAHAPGWKLGGWQDSTADTDPLPPCRCGAPIRPLLEIHRYEQLGGLWTPDRQPDFAWGDPVNWDDQEPTGLAVGDGGYSIRQCTADPRHPLTTAFD